MDDGVVGPTRGGFSWHELFGNDQPVEVEIGPGNGVFVLAAAAARPGTSYFAIEQSHSRARMVEAVVRQRGLDNVRVLRGDAGWVVDHVVPAESVYAYHIYFPDPWWKRRHHRRRIFTPELVDALARTLVPNGYVYLATDVEITFDLMRASLGASTRFQEEPQRPSPRLTLTTFERKGLQRGALIRQTAYRRVA